MSIRISIVVILAVFAFLSSARAADGPTRFRVYFGTYTEGESKGIYVADFDATTGLLSKARLAAEVLSPAFLAIHPDGKHLYCVNELVKLNKQNFGGISAFEIDPETGLLKFINQQMSQGAWPCHLTVDKAGKHILTANYGSGSVACLPINADGSVGPATSVIQHEGSSVNKQRQESPHAHSINLDPANKFAIVCDLGLDKVITYRFDADAGKLKPIDSISIAPGSGPRHFAFHPTEKYAYVLNEILSTITACTYDKERGELKEIHTIKTISEDYKGPLSTAEIVVHPSGKFLYNSNRGDSTLSIFAINTDTGRLTMIGRHATGGKVPRNFAMDPTGGWILAENQDTHNVLVFKVNQETGLLTVTGQEIKVPMPVCAKFLAVK